MGVSRLRNLLRKLPPIRLGVFGLRNRFLNLVQIQMAVFRLQNRFLNLFQIQIAVSLLQILLLTPFRSKMKVPTLQILNQMYHQLINLPICLTYQPLTDFFIRIHMRASSISNHFCKIAKLQNINIIPMSSMFILCSQYLWKI